MKKVIALLSIIALMACKNNTKTEDTSTENEVATENSKELANKAMRTFRGDFIHVAEGAVLKTRNEMYGVTIDDKLKELSKQVAPVKNDEFDMVPVVVKGHLVANPLFVETGEGWRLNITIDEIVSVSDTPAKADLKIEDNKGS